MDQKRILMVPLNWGLGHATRLIPVIREFQLTGAHVILGGSPRHLALLQQEVGLLETVSLPYLTIRLSQGSSQTGIIALQLPRIILAIIREHIALKRIIKTQRIDLVVSDNCFGLWNRSVHCVFITHQVNIEVPGKIKFPGRLINYLNHWFIRQYNECWIPDYSAEGGFAGKLSHPAIRAVKTTYIGVLSRFRDLTRGIIKPTAAEKKNLLILMSGPENQRSKFEELIRCQLHKLPMNIDYKIIRGLPGWEEKLPDGWHNHIVTEQLGKMIHDADYIICRAGYSTIMDLVSLGKTALLVPTPGQSEQEYLADYLSRKGYFKVMKQYQFDIILAILSLEKSIRRPVNSNFQGQMQLDHRVRELLRNGSARKTPIVNNPTK